MMTRILWVGRHAPDEAQTRELEDTFGDVEIDRMDKYIRSAKDIIGKASGYDAVVTILPEYIDMQLIRKGIFPIKSTRTNDTHMGFRVLTKVSIESEPLDVYYGDRVCEICGRVFVCTELRGGVCERCWNEHYRGALARGENDGKI